ncbi:MAG TPA: hypothetical protein VGD97_11995 [Lacunisphaera sp.]
MNRFDHQWQKLTALARQAPAAPGELPYGFATRVAAQAAALPATPWLPLERFALRGLFLAGICSAAAAAFNFSTLTTDQADIYATGTADTVIELLDIS